MAIQADHRVLAAKDGFAPIDRTEVALVASPDASPATLRLADRLAEFFEAVQAKAAYAVPHGEEREARLRTMLRANHEARGPSFETPRSLSSGAHSRDPLAAPHHEGLRPHPEEARTRRLEG